MVPVSYHDFFSGCATVAGALTGLLFVAITVAPEKFTGDSPSGTHQVKAGAAFSALVNTLVIALVALMPGASLNVVAIAASATGLCSTTGLGVLLYREHTGRFRPGQVALLVVLFALYALQLANGAALGGSPHQLNRITTQCALCLIFFVFAIARAWELTGARDRHLWPAIAGMAQPSAGPAPEPPQGQP
jgi:hypothetical protein